MYKNIGDSSGKNLISQGNSTTTPLGAGANFTGEWIECINYASISVVCVADEATTLYGDFSIDGITNDRRIQLSSGLDGDAGIHSLIPIARFFRIYVLNGATPQTSLRLQTILLENSRVAQPTSRLAQTIEDYSDVLNTRAAIVSKNTLGDYVNIESDIEGRLKISNGIYSGFGENVSLKYNPITQFNHIYGLATNSQIHTSFTNSGGTITSSTDGTRVLLNTDTSVGSYAVLRDLRTVKYRHGYTAICRIGGIFDTGVASSLQFLGLGNASSDLYFCMNGTSFGVRRSYGGLLEIYKLTVTAAAAGVESLTITLNSVAFNVSVSNAAADIAFTAHEIEVGGTGATTYTNWNISHIGNDVFFIAAAVGARSGTYSFVNNTGGGTAAASFTQLKGGADLTTEFVAQESWNGNSSLITTLNPLYHNLYEISYSWFGGSNIKFSIYNYNTGLFEVVHTMTFSNQGTTLSLTSPNMYVQRGVASLGSTTALTLESTGAFAAIIGDYDVQKQPKSSISINKSISAGVETVILTLGNRLQINGFPNNSEIKLNSVFIASDGNASMTVKIIKNPTTLSADTTADYTNFNYMDENNSLLVYDDASDTYTGGDVLQRLVVSKNATSFIDLQQQDVFLSREDFIIFTAVSTLTNTVSISCSVISDF